MTWNYEHGVQDEEHVLQTIYFEL